MRYASVIGLPVYTIAKYNGMGGAAGKLRKAGLLTALGGSVLDEGDVTLPHLERDEVQGGVKNLGYFKEATSLIRSSVSRLNAERVILLGGECSLAVGGLAGLVEAFGGKPGMVWMDAHGDFNTPESSPSSYIGGMCLAMACGKGPPLDAAVDARQPLLSEGALVHVGCRALDPPEVKAFDASPARLMPMEEVRKLGAKKAGAEAARRLSDSADWLVCHLDVDVVDPDIILAVNYPTPGGLRPAEASAIIRALDATGKLKVLEIAAYNPSLDDDGSSAAAVVSIVKGAFE